MAVALAFTAVLGACASSSDPNLQPSTPDLASSSLRVSKPVAAADGADAITITVTLKDAKGAPVAGQLVELSVSGSGNALSAPAKTDAQGTTHATLSSVVAEPKTISAQLAQGSLAAQTVTFQVSVADLELSSVFATTPLTADGAASAIVITLRDAHGNPVPNQSVTLAMTGSGNTLVQPPPTDSTGVTIGTIASTHSETKTLTASLSNGPLAEQPTIVFLAGAPTHLVFRTQPTNAVAGEAIAPGVQVELQDAFGNRCPSNATVALAFANNPSAATLIGAAPESAVDGVASFGDLTIVRTGAGYTLQASSSGFAPVTSEGFDVAPAAPSQLAFVAEPRSGLNDQPLAAVQVAVEDSFGNVLAGDARDITVALAANPGGSTLTGSSSLSASSGVASFSTLTLDKTATGYTLLASASGLSTITSTPFDINPAPITGTEIGHYVTDLGVIDSPADLTTSTLAAHVELPDGSFVTYPGSGTSGGDLSIANVPTVTYYFQQGSNYFESATRSWNLEFHAQGRPNQRRVDAGTSIAFDVDGLVPWDVNDQLELYSSNAGAFASDVVLDELNGQGSLYPDAGTTVLQESVAYDRIDLPNAIDATQGDQVDLYQLSTQAAVSTQADAGFFYSAAANLLSTSSFSTLDGQLVSLTGTVTPLPQTESAIQAIDFPSFEARQNELFPGASFLLDAYGIVELPLAGEGRYSSGPDLVSLLSQNAGEQSQTIRFSYGNLHPDWTQFAFFNQVSRAHVTLGLPDGGTAQGNITGSVIVSDALSNMTATTLQPTLSSVRQLTVNGLDATQQTSGVGLNPVIAWQAPALGTPTYYRVRIRELIATPTGTLGFVAGGATFLYTTSTRVRLPPGIFQAGKHYSLTVSATFDPVTDVTARPNEKGVPHVSVDAISNVITP
jgi:hypothetical protein